MAAETAPINEVDPVLLEQALGEVETQRSVPDFFEYFVDLGKAFFVALMELVGSLADAVGGAVSGEFLVGLIFFLLAAGFLLLIYVVIRLWQKRLPKTSDSFELRPEAPASPQGIDWEAELEARLARGDAHAALEALWWSFAQKLGTIRADATWTTRELVLASGRRDLLRAVVPLDRLLYADVVVALDDVRRVRQSLLAVVPPTRTGP